MRLSSSLVALVLTGALAAQEPEQSPAEPAAAGPMIMLGLYGFSARGGVDFEGDGQAVVSIALDAGHVYRERLRVRPSGELGVLHGENTYVVNLELIYRLTADTSAAVPYIGAGIALAGQDSCAAAPDCPDVWAQFALGFELELREGINWLLEYHPENAFRRHRIFVGLTTRRR